MKKLNQNGFGALEGILIFVIVALIGGAGWYVWQRNNDKPSDTVSQQAEKSDKATKVPIEKIPTYTNTKVGISFYKPAAWKFEEKDYGVKNSILHLEITSPDYTEIQGGYGGSETGTRITVWVNKMDVEGYLSPLTDKILSGSPGGKENYTEIKTVTIAGKSGVSYKASYEGPARLTNQFEFNNRQYMINLEEDLNGPKFNDNTATYQKIVDSFKLL